MDLASCLVFMSVVPGIVVVIVEPDALPSMRRPVMTSACPWWALGSFVVCAAAMAAAMLYSFSDCDLYGGLGPFWSGPALLAALLFVHPKGN